MSRTYKDEPYWLRSVRQGVEPRHRCGWFRVPKYVDTDERLPWGGFLRQRIGIRWEYRGDCDLSTNPPPISYENYGKRGKQYMLRCRWEYRFIYDYRSQVRGVPGKRFWRRKEFYGPQRMNERRAAQAAKHGDFEHEFPDGRGRHSVLWDMS